MIEEKKTPAPEACNAESCKADLMNGLLAILAEEEEKAQTEDDPENEPAQ